MLSRYQDKEVRIMTESGEVFTGLAEVFPSGYGLHEFDRAEESIQLGDVLLFQSEIRKIEDLSEAALEDADPRRFDALMDELLEGPCWIVDILPAQVPARSGGQYFAVERYFLQPERIRTLRRSYAELLLRLNCYFDMTVSFDSCMSWETNPDPEVFAAQIQDLYGNSFLRAVFPAQRAMIDLEPDVISMTVYDPDSALLDRMRALAASAGVFCLGATANGYGIKQRCSYENSHPAVRKHPRRSDCALRQAARLDRSGQTADYGG